MFFESIAAEPHFLDKVEHVHSQFNPQVPKIQQKSASLGNEVLHYLLEHLHEVLPDAISPFLLQVQLLAHLSQTFVPTPHHISLLDEFLQSLEIPLQLLLQLFVGSGCSIALEVSLEGPVVFEDYELLAVAQEHVLELPSPSLELGFDEFYGLVPHFFWQPVKEQQVVLVAGRLERLEELPQVVAILLQSLHLVSTLFNLLAVLLEVGLVESQPMLLEVLELIDILHLGVLLGLH